MCKLKGCGCNINGTMFYVCRTVCARGASTSGWCTASYDCTSCNSPSYTLYYAAEYVWSNQVSNQSFPLIHILALFSSNFKSYLKGFYHGIACTDLAHFKYPSDILFHPYVFQVYSISTVTAASDWCHFEIDKIQAELFKSGFKKLHMCSHDSVALTHLLPACCSRPQIFACTQVPLLFPKRNLLVLQHLCLVVFRGDYTCRTKWIEGTENRMQENELNINQSPKMLDRIFCNLSVNLKLAF